MQLGAWECGCKLYYSSMVNNGVNSGVMISVQLAKPAWGHESASENEVLNKNREEDPEYASLDSALR